MDKLTQKLREQFIIEQFIEARKVFAWDPLEFQDKDGNKVDDRSEDGAQSSTAFGDEVDEV